MFYEPERGHGLPHDPINALVIPRPIGWVSSIDINGMPNLAPFALFNLVAYMPPHVMFAPTGEPTGRAKGTFKDSLNNVQATGEFVINMATWELRDQVWQSSIPAPPGVSEFGLTGLTPIASQLVKPPRVKESPVHLECKLVQIVRLPHTNPDSANHIVIGKVVGVHIDDSILVDGKVDYAKITPMARLGYTDYTRVGEVFTKPFPKWPPTSEAG
ncbi:MAG: flavin reductase family protein [Rhodospirillaceae bacterium]|nr:flavin reductase family protein [Rhodospirillaceae bacterium]